MSEAPITQPTPTAHAGGKGVHGFLTNDLAGMPTWVWIVVLVAGIGAAVIIPKLLNGSSKASTGNATTTGTTPDSGLGLAIDPTTGLPYAVEGLVPSGNAGAGNPPPLPPIPTPVPTQPPPVPTPTPAPTCPPGYTFQASNGTGGKKVTPIKGSIPVVGGYCVPLPVMIPPTGDHDHSHLHPGSDGGPVPMPPVIGPLSTMPVQEASPAWPGGTTQVRIG